MNFDLNLIAGAPDFSSQAILSISTLSALSLVAQMPGKYYRSQSAPTDMMVLGLLENALGWHIGESDRLKIIKDLAKKHKLPGTGEKSGVGFRSVLQFHIRFGTRMGPDDKAVSRFDDYWSQHLRTGGIESFGGSREYDSRLNALRTAVANKTITITDSKGITSEEDALAFKPGDKINISAIRALLPRYYSSPTAREYVETSHDYRYALHTSQSIMQALGDAISDPQAPLYLGSNDGWVDASLEVMA